MPPHVNSGTSASTGLRECASSNTSPSPWAARNVTDPSSGLPAPLNGTYNIGFWNLDGMRIGKWPAINSLTKEHRLDLLGVVELQTREDASYDLTNRLLIPDNNRATGKQGRPGGGHGWYVRERMKDEVESSPPLDVRAHSVNWFVPSLQKRVILTVTHILPTSRTERLEQIRALLYHLQNLHKNKSKILLGDFNVGWLDETAPTTKPSTRQRLYPELLKLAGDVGLVQLEFAPSPVTGTHNSGAFIDLAFATPDIAQELGKVHVIDTAPSISDHRLLILRTKLLWERESLPPRERLTPSILGRTRPARPADVENYRTGFQAHYNPPQQQASPGERWDRIKSAILMAKEELPKGNSDFQTLKMKKRRTQKYDKRGKVTKPYNDVKRQIKKLSNEANLKKLNDHISNRLQGLEQQHKNSAGPTSGPSTSPLPTRPDTTCPKLEAELIKHFQTIGTYKGETDPRWKQQIEEEVGKLHATAKAMGQTGLGRTVTVDELFCALTKQKKGKQGGADRIPVDLLLWLPEDGLAALIDLYNACLEAGEVPEDWLEGIVTRILKPNRDPAKFASYRPLTLLNTAWKTLETILLQRMVALGVPEHLFDEQMGFQKGKGCRDQLFVVTEAIRKAKGGLAYVAFLDIRKAFDSVWKAGLLTKLWDYGVRGQAFTIITNFYSNLTARIILPDGTTSSPYQVLVGTAQGSVLSPLFFNLFINDLIKDVNACNVGLTFDGTHEKLACALFADDIALLANTPHELQQLLTATEQYAEKWMFRFATDLEDPKRKVVVYYPTLIPPPVVELYPQVLLQNVVLPVVDRYDYLGVCLGGAQTLYSLAVTTALAKAWNHLRLQQIQLQNQKLSRTQRFLQLKLYILPKLEYGLEALHLDGYQLQRLDSEESKMAATYHLKISVWDTITKRLERRRREFLRGLLQKPHQDFWREFFARRADS
eukprot:Lithocolla_globosa_v1_NODE_869_length_3165_cov_27.732797.p1 type:complete len:941 gc:universal NODE_869_length_3165_cov_27.732797:3008-186(-)